MRTLRARVAIWIGVSLAGCFVIAMIGTLFFLKYAAVSQADSLLRDIARGVTEAIEHELGEAMGLRRGSASALEAFKFYGVRIYVYDAHHQLVAQSDTLSLLPSAAPSTETKAQSPLARAVISQHDQNYRFISLPGADQGARAVITGPITALEPFQLAVVKSLVEEDALFEQFYLSALIILPLLLMACALIGWGAARGALAPIENMTRRAENIDAAHLDHRLPVANRIDELSRLAVVFNRLLDRLSGAIQAQRRFMTDSSHELRTPVALLRMESEIALSKSSRDAGEYRESLTVMGTEVERLSHIVEDLFTLSRADAGQYPVDFEDVYLDEVVQECARAVQPLAERGNVRLDVSADKVVVHGDEALLRRLIINLLDNALQHTPDGGSVRIDLIAQNDGCSLRVQDTGNGIPTEAQAHIFERFYRAEHSRRVNERTAKGAGLGLAIAKWIAELHDGSLQLEHSSATGTSFRLNLPRAVGAVA